MLPTLPLGTGIWHGQCIATCGIPPDHTGMPSWQETAEGKINKQQYHKKTPPCQLFVYATMLSAPLLACLLWTHDYHKVFWNLSYEHVKVECLRKAAHRPPVSERSRVQHPVSTKLNHQEVTLCTKKSGGGGPFKKNICQTNYELYRRSANTNKENDVKHMYVN